ncbi:MAG: hypothetical protein RLZZ399_516 [Verrucomicrobiota bacterium]|jgi:hypothetical protein
MTSAYTGKIPSFLGLIIFPTFVSAFLLLYVRARTPFDADSSLDLARTKKVVSLYEKWKLDAEAKMSSAVWINKEIGVVSIPITDAFDHLTSRNDRSLTSVTKVQSQRRPRVSDLGSAAFGVPPLLPSAPQGASTWEPYFHPKSVVR